MNEEIIEVEAIQTEIVSCPRCGQRNRLVRQSREVQFKCGRCNSALDSPFDLIQSTSTIQVWLRTIRKGSSFWTFGLGGAVLLILVLFAAMIFLISDEPSKSSNESFRPISFTTERGDLPTLRQLANNSILVRNVQGDGDGVLSVHNGNKQDAVIFLVEAVHDLPVYAFYTRSNDRSLIEGIPDGRYRVLFSTGVDWDDGRQKFTRKQAFAIFEDTIDFTTKRTRSGIEYSTIELTLHPVFGGTALTETIDESTFLRYMQIAQQDGRSNE